MSERTQELIAFCLIMELIISKIFGRIVKIAQNPYCQRSSIERLIPVLDRNFLSIIGFIKAEWREANLSKEDLVEVARYMSHLEDYFHAHKESILAMKEGDKNEQQN